MTAKLHRVRLLKVMRAPDAMHWTAKLVGEYVPYLGHYEAYGEFRSREPSGHVNFLPADDACVVKVFVDEGRLGDYPYKYAKADTPATYRTPEAVIAGLAKQQGCAASCDRMGICQALDDCQDKPCIDAELAKTAPATSQAAPVGQSRAHSMAETLASIAVGFVVSMALQALVLPAMGHHITLAQNFWITCIFTLASVLRGYGMRRLFNHLHTQRNP